MSLVLIEFSTSFFFFFSNRKNMASLEQVKLLHFDHPLDLLSGCYILSVIIRHSVQHCIEFYACTEKH